MSKPSSSVNNIDGGDTHIDCRHEHKQSNTTKILSNQIISDHSCKATLFIVFFIFVVFNLFVAYKGDIC